ncbi:GNAT family N-acetyltransferase [Oceanirhabdus sp. W0125-5]|uniref:GNAT family N-acetyltransferase n=1 Tax=Oceanirhabdus sp. W0125-5 TaxID=2999116 RepID=UPI0022F31B6C|nr:GNAT family N-acetyltransferase [Oceanirhabdus sp. W0125-5]WBW96916.1 GNAT family N-acetyltransferase [Oceanirhabdus sp. W0125-5]
MKGVNVTKGELSDLKEIMIVIKKAIQKMHEEGIYQWDEYYPNEERFTADIRNSSLYVLRENHEGSIIGVAALDGNQESEYAKVNWNYVKCTLDEEEIETIITEDVSFSLDGVLVIHRLAMNPEYQGKGYARKFIEELENEASRRGAKVIRLDCYSCNEKANGMYRKLGYRYSGDVYFRHKEEPFHCYDKAL